MEEDSDSLKTPAEPSEWDSRWEHLSCQMQYLVNHVRAIEDRVERIEGATVVHCQDGHGDDVVCEGPLVIDHPARRVVLDGREVSLSPTEFRLLDELVAHTGEVVSHDELLRNAAPASASHRENLKVYIGRLRAKLANGSDANLDIQAIRGIGYRLSLD